jgi:hypothetical protein
MCHNSFSSFVVKLSPAPSALRTYGNDFLAFSGKRPSPMKRTLTDVTEGEPTLALDKDEGCHDGSRLIPGIADDVVRCEILSFALRCLSAA